MDEIDFGDYVIIEMKRYGAPNEHFTHKVIGRIKSNFYVDVPVDGCAKNTIHSEMEECISAICCGVDETEVRKYRVQDVTKIIKESR